MVVKSSESTAMHIAKFLGLRRIRWALRRLYVPVDSRALVLEVGSGGNPYPRANVLLDGFESSSERIESALVRDRPFVLGLCEKLPFRDKAFDFVIASHVLEHTDDPEAFLSELQRVARAGYIETPDAFFERINPYTYHRLEVTSDGRELIIQKKTRWNPDPEVVGLYEKKLQRDHAFQRFIRIFPDALYVRFFWSDHITYRILNPGADAGWDYPAQVQAQSPDGLKQGARSLYLRFIRRMFSQNRRNAKIDILELLQCVECGHAGLQKQSGSLSCKNCRRVYPVINGIPRMFVSEIGRANQTRSHMRAPGAGK